MRRTRIAATVVFLCTAALVAASGALAATPHQIRHAQGGGLPFTGIDLNVVVAGALALMLLGVTLRRLARQRP